MPAPPAPCIAAADPAATRVAVLGRRKLIAIASPLLTGMWSPPASAHAVLVESDPPSGGSIGAGRRVLRLRFNSRIDQARSRLTLVAGNHAPVVLAIAADSAVDELRTEVTLEPGAAVVRWQVLATDGHITRGEVPFTVAGK